MSLFGFTSGNRLKDGIVGRQLVDHFEKTQPTNLPISADFISGERRESVVYKITFEDGSESNYRVHFDIANDEYSLKIISTTKEL